MAGVTREAPLPAGEAKARAVRDMFDAIARRYDVVNRVMTFGMDVGWRRRAVRALRLPSRALVADLACGTGDLCRELGRAGYRAVGFDFAREMLAAARTGAPMCQADVLALPLRDASVDGATCGFALRNVVDLERLVDETARIVRAGGRISLLEVSEPSHPLLRRGHAIYFNRVVPLIGGLLSDREAYRYLPRSVAYLPPPHRVVAMLGRAGFADAARVGLSGGVAQLFVGTRS